MKGLFDDLEIIQTLHHSTDISHLDLQNNLQLLSEVCYNLKNYVDLCPLC